MIAPSWRNWIWKLGLASTLAVGGAITSLENTALAQITPDTSLGSENSTVTSTGSLDHIKGGATRGTNLFHSFREFNVGNGRSTYFTNPAGIENILGRVTGTNASNILGTLGVSGGNANLFLINPNGIIFGPDSQLDINGSFVGTTANGVGLANGDSFSTNPGEPLPTGLLNVNPNAFLFNQLAAQPIIQNQSRSGLEVDPGRSLLLLGGNVSLDGGILQALGGRVELRGIAEAGNVGLEVDGNNLGLSFPDDVQRADVSLSNRALVNVSGEGGGYVQIQGRQVTLTDASAVLSNTLGSQDGRGISIQASQLNVRDGAEVSATALSSEPGAGQGGTLSVTADAVELSGTSVDGQPSRLFANTSGTGAAGNLTIQTGQLTVQGGAQVSAGTFDEGPGGTLSVTAFDSVNVVGLSANGIPSGLFTQADGPGTAGSLTIQTKQLSIQDGALISAGIFGSAGQQGGNLSVAASESIEVTGTSVIGRFLFPSGLYTQTRGTGAAGNLTVQTRQLSIREGAEVSARTYSEGGGGNLFVTASESVELLGGNLFADTSGAGNAGDLRITTGKLIVQDGSVIGVGAFAKGRGGDLDVTASESVEVIGKSTDGGRSNSGLFTSTFGTGAAGDLTIQTGQLTVRDGAQVGTGTFGKGQGGNLTVAARESIEVIGSGQFSFPTSGLFASTEGTGAAGNLTIDTGRLLVQKGAQVSASTFGEGLGGILTVIAADSVELIGRSTNDRTPSGLFASTEGGTKDAGDLTIQTGQLSIREGARVSASTSGEGLGGDITLKANTVEAVSGGQVFTTSFSSGRAGNIIANVSDNISLSGSDLNYFDRFGKEVVTNAAVFGAGPASGLFANTSRSSTAQGGDLSITAGQVVVRDGAEVGVSSPSGQAGNLEVTGNAIVLDQGKFTAVAGAGDGGNIELGRVPDLPLDLLLMRNNSEISAEALAKANGGNINIDTNNLVALENSDITANAFKGRGGEIRINTQGDFRSLDSDISASSKLGIDGVVELNTPDVDPSSGLVSLPVVPVETEVVQACAPGDTGTESEFVVTGRGGLPTNPTQVLSRDAIEVDWVTLTHRGEDGSTPAVLVSPTAPESASVVEAQGWVVNRDGEVVLTASANSAQPRSAGLPPGECRTSQSATKD